MNKVNFWNNKEEAEETISRLNNLKEIVEPLTKVKETITNNLEIISLLEEEQDAELLENITNDTQELEAKIANLQLLLLLNGKYDSENCIVEIHPGAGGTESCDWALMLYRMYTRWCERKNYKIEILDYQDGDEAGLKSVSFLVKGTNAYGYLKNEKGIHRLVRLSPFDSNNRRHTSFASIEVTPDIKIKNMLFKF